MNITVRSILTNLQLHYITQGYEKSLTSPITSDAQKYNYTQVFKSVQYSNNAKINFLPAIKTIHSCIITTSQRVDKYKKLSYMIDWSSASDFQNGCLEK